MIATVTSKGQVTIPKAVRNLLGIGPKDKVDFRIENDRVVLTPVKTLADFRGAVQPIPGADIEAERAAFKTRLTARSAPGPL